MPRAMDGGSITPAWGSGAAQLHILEPPYCWLAKKKVFCTSYGYISAQTYTETDVQLQGLCILTAGSNEFAVVLRNMC